MQVRQAASDVSWRIAAAVFGAVVLVRIAYKIASQTQPSLVNPLVAWSISILQILASVLLLVSVILLSGNMVVGAYHLLLLVVLFLSAYHFIRVAVSVLAMPSAES